MAAGRTDLPVGSLDGDAHDRRAIALQQQGRPDEAVAVYRQLLAIAPDHGPAHYSLANILAAQGRFDAAEALYRRALQLLPGRAGPHNNLGNVMLEQGRFEEAALYYRQALAIDPALADAHSNLGHALHRLGQREEAETACRRALAIRPDHAFAHNNLGNLLYERGAPNEAAACYRRALAIAPDHALAHNNLGNILYEQGRLDEALASYRRALASKPDYALALAQKLQTQAQMCDWSETAELGALIATLGISGEAVPPFPMLAVEDHPARHRQRSENWARLRLGTVAAECPARPSSTPARIRIGYFSADFHDHATMYLMAGLFREHDRQRFEISVYSYGRNRSGAMREQLRGNVDRLVDVDDAADDAIVALARSHGLDIAVDLMGYTRDARSQLFARRLAPVQISFLGYPGTMATPAIDYLIADRLVIPANQREHYAEKILYLPHSYQVNDDRRLISDRSIGRARLGLPENGFVFCCFNNNYKITSVEFAMWARLMQRVDHSVLWLLKTNRWAEANLRREAQARGIDPARLIFAHKLPQAEHLARQRCADLFLDTFNYNAHTTASDALWAGLPVVTRLGQGFAARVAGSLLHAVGLPELVTQTAEDYEALALALATEPDRLAAIRAKLAANRTTTPLFDTALFTRHIEAAYRAAYLRYVAGEGPEDIAIGQENPAAAS